MNQRANSESELATPASSRAASDEPGLQAAPVENHRQSWQARWSGFAAMLTASLAIYFAAPGWNLWPLAIAVMLPLSWLVERSTLPGPRPYLKLWLASWIGQIALLSYLRGAHLGAAIGWPILAAYLAVYPVLFVGLTRIAVHRWRIPAWLSAAILWMGLEWVRANLFTGFAMALLGHSVYRVPVLIQISDLAGGYLVSALLVLWGFLIARLFAIGLSASQSPTRKEQFVLALLLIASLASTLVYGVSRISVEPSGRSLNVALVQGSIDAHFPGSLEEERAYWQAIESQYRLGTLLVRERAPATELIVWPESKLAVADIYNIDLATLDAEQRRKVEDSQINLEAYLLNAYGVWTYEELRAFDPYAQESDLSYRDRFRAFVQTRQANLIPLLAGCLSIDVATDDLYNAAVLVDDSRNVVARYHKNHLVMFGETIPFGETLPWLYSWAPFQPGLRSGRQGVAMQVGELALLPSICFESTVPHLLRRQCLELEAAGQKVDVLVNVSDDSWFHGAFGLDQHLACNLFRAVELRKPMLVAANGGLSVIADGKGRIQVEAPRSIEAQLIGVVRAETMQSLYLQAIGDWPAILAATICGVMAVSGLRRRTKAE